MPTFPQSTVCDTLQCKAPRMPGSAHCEAHGGKPKLSATRLESNRAYKTRLWESIRAAQLSRMPLCQACTLDQRITAAAHVDHVFPWRQIGQHAFTRNLFQSLCVEHHSYKTGKEKHGVIIHWVEGEEKTLTLEDYAVYTHE